MRCGQLARRVCQSQSGHRTIQKGAEDILKAALEKSIAIGAQALTGVVFGGIGERSGQPPTRAELDNVAGVLTRSAKACHTIWASLWDRTGSSLRNAPALGAISRAGSNSLSVWLPTETGDAAFPAGHGCSGATFSNRFGQLRERFVRWRSPLRRGGLCPRYANCANAGPSGKPTGMQGPVVLRAF